MARRLTLVNSTFSAMPIYTMSTLKFSSSVINAIDQARRDYIWKGSDVNASQTLLLPGIRLLV